MALDPFQKGEKVWVHGRDGALRPAIYVGDDPRMRRGPLRAYVVFEDTRKSGKVQVDRVTRRK